MKTKRLYKTTIVIWSDRDPGGAELEDLAHDAASGDSHCSKMKMEVIEDPSLDPDWDGTEFFDFE